MGLVLGSERRQAGRYARAQTHTDTHTHRYTHSHTHTNTHTHTRTHTLTHMQMRAHTKRRQDVHIGSMRVCMYTLLNIKPYTCLLAYAYIKKYFAHIYIYIYIHTNMHTYVPPQHSTEGLGAAQHGKTRPCMHTLHYTALHYPVLHTYIYPSIHPSIHACTPICLNRMLSFSVS